MKEEQQQLVGRRGYLEAQRTRRIQEALSSMQWVTDILVSASVGSSVSLWLLLHQQKDVTCWEEAPLVAGKSVIAEEMCPLVLEWLKQKKKHSPSSSFYEADHPSLQRFAENCRRRSDFLSQRRKQQTWYGGLLQADVVPHPGVPKDN